MSGEQIKKRKFNGYEITVTKKSSGLFVMQTDHPDIDTKWYSAHKFAHVVKNFSFRHVFNVAENEIMCIEMKKEESTAD